MQSMSRRIAVALLLLCGFGAAHADGTAQTLPLSQDWDNTGLITTSDDWSGVPGITGYRGDGITGSTGVDPQTLLGEGIVTVDVNANQAAPDTFGTGGVAEFEIADPAVALQGSGTADAPNLVINLNTTGSTGINVAYNVRDIDGSADDAIQQVALQYRIGSSGDFINLPGGYIADATTGGTATQVTPVSVQLPVGAENQALVQVRVITANASGSDEWVGIDDIAITAGGGGGEPAIFIDDVSQNEGDAGDTIFTFTISLTQPVPTGYVSFDLATADNTATTADFDYSAVNVTDVRIFAGESSRTFDVTVNGDPQVEATETFFLDLSNVSGAIVGDAQGVATLVNDDITLTAIHDIQGPGASSPLVGASVTTRGIVTGRKGNGFFMQAADADNDNNGMTSEGVFVYTGGAPPADAAVGNAVQVQGTVVEFVPSQDPLQPPLTEIGSVTSVVALSSGNPLPIPFDLNGFPPPDAPFDLLEMFEGMRVSAFSLTVVAPTGGFTDEPDATGTSNGVFHAVSGGPRPFREPGIQAPDPAPPCCGTIPPIPRWDSNPELIAVDSDALGGPVLDLATGTQINNLTGPLDYGFRRYTILRDPDVAIQIQGNGMPPDTARWPDSDEFTIASYNLERFFDTVNDPDIGEPVLTAVAFGRRLNKASIGIREHLNRPDILAVVEVENLSTLQALADKINADDNMQPHVEYAPVLIEGNDVGGIDVGFLVSTRDTWPGFDRVEVESVSQLGADALFINPDSSTELLNDRPPLLLDAVVHYDDGREFPVSVIAVHQRSLNGADSLEPGSNGWGTVGERVRAKRQVQAEDLANRIQTMQVADPLRRIAVLGDFNAFEFNDGLTDALNVIKGTPTPDEETATTGDGIDLVTPDLLAVPSLAPPEFNYSFLFGGNAQSLDHALANEALLLATEDFELQHVHINADFPEEDRNDPTTARHLSDHDPLVAYFTAPPQQYADLVAAASTSTPEVGTGQPMQFTANVVNTGPDVATQPGFGFALDAALPDLAVVPPTDWSCGTPQIENGITSVACTAASLAVDASAEFALTATAPDFFSAVTLMALADSETFDPNEFNNQASASVNVIPLADLAVQWTLDTSGSILLFRADLSNIGPDDASNAVIVLDANIQNRYVTLTPPAGWQCVRLNNNPRRALPLFVASCELQGTLQSGAVAGFELQVPRSVLANTPQVNLQADVASSTVDPDPDNNSASASTTGLGPVR